MEHDETLFTEHLKDDLMTLARDRVPNVRISLALMLSELCSKRSHILRDIDILVLRCSYFLRNIDI